MRSHRRPELATDPIYRGRELRIKNEASLLAVLRTEFAKQPTAYWTDRLTAAGVMNAPVQTYGDFLDHPQARAVAAVEYVDHPDVGTIAVAQIPGTPSVSSQSAGRSTAPLIGEHTTEILGEIGVDDATIRRMQAEGSIGGYARGD